MIAYCMGLGIPFVLLAFGSAGAVSGLGWLRRHSRGIQIFGGALLIAVGAALVTGVWNDFISWLRDALVSRREVADLMRSASRRSCPSRLLAARSRNTWRSLTSMGTALVLLFLLALGAIPGALLPQRSLNAGKVNDYLTSTPGDRSVAGSRCRPSTCSPASGSPPSTCCCSCRWSAA